MAVLAHPRGAPRQALVQAGLGGLGAAVFIAAGIVASHGVVPTVVLSVAAIALALVTRPQRASQAFSVALSVILIGYAFLGKGFAYLGASGFHVGEVALVAGVVALLVARGRSRLTVVEWMIVAFAVLGFARTAPFLDDYGKLALRDAVIWGYAVFALGVALTLSLRAFDRGLSAYGVLAMPFVALVPIAAYVVNARPDLIPTLPEGSVSFVGFKAGDAAVHLAGIGAFVLLGLRTRPSSKAAAFAFWCLWLAGVIVVGAISRGALLAVIVAFAAVLFARPARSRRAVIAGAAAVTALTLVALRPAVDVGLARAVSLSQITSNVATVFGGGPADAAGTRSFRLRWWSSIVDYTVHGPYFWGGKGFGVNLADVDGFQTTLDHSLRAPHNSHLTILARMGVPGLGVWLTLQASLGIALLRAYRRALRHGATRLAAIAMWIFTYWLAMLVNASFDPYLEGPQGGIWFWTIVGAAVALTKFVGDATKNAEARP